MKSKFITKLCLRSAALARSVEAPFRATFVAIFFAVAGMTTAFAQSNALAFDGTDDAVNLGNTLGNFGTGDFTVELSIKTTQASQFVMAKRPVCGHASFWNLSIGDGQLVVEVDGDYSGGNYAAITTPKPINDGAWHHIALVRAAAQVTLYIDGVVAGANTMPATATLHNDAPLYLGVNGACGGLANFGGTMDEVRLWSVARSAADIIAFSKKSIAPSTAALTAYYPCDVAAATLTDATGHNYNGTMTGFTAAYLVADSPIAANAPIAANKPTLPASAAAPAASASQAAKPAAVQGGTSTDPADKGKSAGDIVDDLTKTKPLPTISVDKPTSTPVSDAVGGAGKDLANTSTVKTVTDNGTVKAIANNTEVKAVGNITADIVSGSGTTIVAKGTVNATEDLANGDFKNAGKELGNVGIGIVQTTSVGAAAPGVYDAGKDLTHGDFKGAKEDLARAGSAALQTDPRVAVGVAGAKEVLTNEALQQDLMKGTVAVGAPLANEMGVTAGTIAGVEAAGKVVIDATKPEAEAAIHAAQVAADDAARAKKAAEEEAARAKKVAEETAEKAKQVKSREDAERLAKETKAANEKQAAEDAEKARIFAAQEAEKARIVRERAEADARAVKENAARVAAEAAKRAAEAAAAAAANKAKNTGKKAVKAIKKAKFW